jgi:diguanylate cyclase (GGDEF)-like protein
MSRTNAPAFVLTLVVIALLLATSALLYMLVTSPPRELSARALRALSLLVAEKDQQIRQYGVGHPSMDDPRRAGKVLGAAIVLVMSDAGRVEGVFPIEGDARPSSAAIDLKAATLALVANRSEQVGQFVSTLITLRQDLFIVAVAPPDATGRRMHFYFPVDVTKLPNDRSDGAFDRLRFCGPGEFCAARGSIVTAANGAILGELRVAPARHALVLMAMFILAVSLVARWGIRRMVKRHAALSASLRRLEASLRQSRLAAGVDPLTGIANRRAFMDELRAAMRDAWAGRRCVLFCVDLDGFKLVNDGLGHAAGDLVLFEVAARLRALCPQSLCIARMGGDEFAILIEEKSLSKSRDAVGRSIVERIAEPMTIDGQIIEIGASVGYSSAPDQAHDEAELIRYADLATYAAKNQGRNRAVAFDRSLDAAIRTRRALEREVRGALLLDEFRVHLQPIVRATTGSLLMVEALARWHHPVRGLLPAATFIEAAEQGRLIDRLGLQMLREAVEHAKTYDIAVAVNVSSRQLRDETFGRRVMAILEETALDPKKLQVEVNELALSDNLPERTATLRWLREHGVRVVLDDFGLGLSLARCLDRDAFDGLKIARSLIAASIDNVESAAIVHSVAGLACSLGIQVTAVGVETEEQRRFLTNAGCYALQGALFGMPEPADRLMAQWQARRAERAAA